MKSTSIILMIMMLSLCSACYTRTTTYCMNEVFYLSESEKKELLIEADHGDANACRRLANYYEFIEMNPAKRNFWLKKGAELGDVVAQYNSAFFLINSKDKNDQQEAISWLKKAADQGNIDAYLRLAEIYENGLIVEQDLVLAKKYYEKAAARGDTSALKELSYFYYQGKGCAPDKPRAYALLSFAKTLLDERCVNYQILSNKQESMRLSEAEKAQAELELDLLKRAYSRNQEVKEPSSPSAQSEKQ